MTDIMLDSKGDMKVSAVGDISITESVRQAVMIRLRWIFQEWRLGPKLGFPWFEEVFVKNPNLPKLRQLIRDEIMKVSEVTAAAVTNIDFDRAARVAKITYTCTVGEDTFRDEVTIWQNTD